MSAERSPRPQLAVSRLTVPLLIGLVAAVVGVSAVLAYEAYRARYSMRVTAERALAQYATMAAWELDAAMRTRLDRNLSDLFAPVLSGVAASPYERTLEPALLLQRASALGVSCGDGATVLRVDLATERATVAGAPIASATLNTITQNVQQQLRGTSAAATRFVIALDSTRSAAIAAVGIRSARFGAPIAAYVVPDCGGVLVTQGIREVLRGHALLPASVRGAIPNDSLVAVRVLDAQGDVVFANAPPSEVAEGVQQPIAAVPGILAQIALRPSARGVLLVAPPERSRLPLLVGLLLLCVVLALVALIQLRREHELARLRADFTSSVSHELRTPLAQILLFSETLKLGRARSDEERALAATSIVREARRLMHMVENVLHFTRRRESDGRPEPLDLPAYLDEIVASFAPLAAAAGMRLETRVQEIAVIADAAMLRQVLLNVLDNAIKYGSAGQTVVVAAERADSDATNGNGSTAHRRVHITVSDEGPGIAVSDRERVWSPYVRLRGNGLPRTAGSGIGLAVVRELVEAMGGRTWVEAVHPDGRGARFVIELAAQAFVVRPRSEEVTRQGLT